MTTRSHKRDRGNNMRRAPRDIAGCYECGHPYEHHYNNGTLIMCTECPGHLCSFTEEDQ